MSDKIVEGYQFREPAEKTLIFMQDTSKRLTNFEITMHDLQNDVKNIKDALSCNSDEHRELKGLIEKFIESANKTYVNYDVFSPVRKLVYGATGVILTIVVTALIYLLLKDKF